MMVAGHWVHSWPEGVAENHGASTSTGIDAAAQSMGWPRLAVRRSGVTWEPWEGASPIMVALGVFVLVLSAAGPPLLLLSENEGGAVLLLADCISSWMS